MQLQLLQPSQMGVHTDFNKQVSPPQLYYVSERQGRSQVLHWMRDHVQSGLTTSVFGEKTAPNAHTSLLRLPQLFDPTSRTTDSSPEEGETTGNEPQGPKPCPTGGAGTASQCCESGQGAGVLAIPLLQTRVNRPRWGFPAVQWLSLHAPITGDTGLILTRAETHMLHGTAKTVVGVWRTKVERHCREQDQNCAHSPTELGGIHSRDSSPRFSLRGLADISDMGSAGQYALEEGKPPAGIPQARAHGQRGRARR